MIDDSLSASVKDNSGRQLSCRELEILTLLAKGHSNYFVAEKLCVSKRTVDFHLSNAYRKLRVSNRVQAILTIGRLKIAPEEPEFALICSIVDRLLVEMKQTNRARG